nr:MAG TPA: hypothetical protein [Caudoviricetes sp.]
MRHVELKIIKFLLSNKNLGHSFISGTMFLFHKNKNIALGYSIFLVKISKTGQNL